jgi:hypothetical protein
MQKQLEARMTVTQNSKILRLKYYLENSGQKNRNGETTTVLFYHVFY